MQSNNSIAIIGSGVLAQGILFGILQNVKDKNNNITEVSIFERQKEALKGFGFAEQNCNLTFKTNGSVNLFNHLYDESIDRWISRNRDVVIQKLQGFKDVISDAEMKEILLEIGDKNDALGGDFQDILSRRTLVGWYLEAKARETISQLIANGVKVNLIPNTLISKIENDTLYNEKLEPLNYDFSQIIIATGLVPLMEFGQNSDIIHIYEENSIQKIKDKILEINNKKQNDLPIKIKIDGAEASSFDVLRAIFDIARQFEESSIKCKKLFLDVVSRSGIIQRADSDTISYDANILTLQALKREIPHFNNNPIDAFEFLYKKEVGAVCLERGVTFLKEEEFNFEDYKKEYEKDKIELLREDLQNCINPYYAVKQNVMKNRLSIALWIIANYGKNEEVKTLKPMFISRFLNFKKEETQRLFFGNKNINVGVKKLQDLKERDYDFEIIARTRSLHPIKSTIYINKNTNSKVVDLSCDNNFLSSNFADNSFKLGNFLANNINVESAKLESKLRDFDYSEFYNKELINYKR
jgi:hypothetical protein